MKKLTVGFCFCMIWFFVAGQNLPSPEQFLGYPLGSHFTPHFKIVSYFKKAAQSMPEMMKLEQYGETYEGRPLLLAYVGSEENMKRLESIRQNNLRLAGVIADNSGADENTPVIVWLSYNVHGNEPASSEAAMKTLFELLNVDNAKTKQWLKNVIVIIDPCINPDGRDRYVNWYNSIVGKSPDPNPQAREHREPWPAGRTNHYNFDLNRDWAWQTQLETQQRLKKYNDWLPQVHVDYHEQGYNAPYYFAPAAEPYHEVITPWQREFQELIGRNNAKYFDQNGWLYFTRERFDLFYPSYGDTYPMYSGAIGMTFEQGGIGAGLAVKNREGDTLTLADRLLHHYTTGMSTIEVSSQNQARIVKEFHKYFINANSNPGGEFKSFIIKSEPNSDRLSRIKILLDRNRISWGNVASGTFSGFSYQTQKSETFRAESGDIFINTNQPKSNLIRVLFERNSKISDSATYDITAWSVPLVYGLSAYAISTPLRGAQAKQAVSDSTIATIHFSYGCAVPWSGVNSAKFLAAILRQSVKVRFTEEAFSTSGQQFQKGTLIITRTSNTALADGLEDVVNQAARMAQVTIVPISTGFVSKGFDLGSDRVHMITRPQVALLTGPGVSASGAGEVWHFFEQQLDYPVTLVSVEDLARTNLKNFDVIIMPDGSYKFISDNTVAEGLKTWIRAGGKLIAMEGAVSQLAKADWGIKAKEENEKGSSDLEKEKKADYSILHRYEDRERDNISKGTPGAIYEVELDNSHPLAFGYPSYYFTLRQDANVYEFIKDGGWNVGVIKKDNYISGFAGSRAKEKLKDALIFGVKDMGSGHVIFLADDPLFRSFWENGKLLFCNAVFMVGQ